MPERLIRLLPWVLLAAFVGVFLFLLTLPYPLLGQDAFYFFPRILSAQWHFHHAGLVPYRYDPHLCGGFPQYGNPQDLSFSLVQFLSTGMDLLLASELSIILLLLLGYPGWVRLGRDVLHLSPAWAHAFGIILSANGYTLLHLVLGHLTFATTPLLGWFLWFLLDPTPLHRNTFLLRAALFSLLCGFILLNGGYLILIQGTLLLLFLLPFDLALRGNMRGRIRTFMLRIPVFALSAVLLSASKLTAIFSLMRFFPRYADFHPYAGDDPLFLFLAKSFWMIPQVRFTRFTQPYLTAPHEFSMHLSPVTLLGIVLLPWLLWKQRHALTPLRCLLLGLGISMIVMFSAALGWGEGQLAEMLHRLPVFASWRMNMRLLSVVNMLTAITGAAAFALCMERLFPGRSRPLSLAASLLTIIAFVLAHKSLISPAYLDLQLPYPQVRDLITRSGYLEKPVTFVEDYIGKDVSDFQYVLTGTTGTTCYETLRGGAAFLGRLKPGPVDQVINGAFNMNHPACLQYPEANGCAPGDRIPASDRENFLRFVTGQQPRWALPWWQRLMDAATLIMIATCIGFAGWRFLRRILWCKKDQEP